MGAGVGELIRGGVNASIFGPLALAAGVVGELVVLGDYPGQLTWLPLLLITVGALAALVLVGLDTPAARVVAVSAAVAWLLVAPSTWAVDTLGHATSGTFPAGGPASVQTGAGGPPAHGRGAGGSPASRAPRTRSSPATQTSPASAGSPAARAK